MTSRIINLSSIFKLKKIIPDGLKPFVELCNNYSKSSCLCSGTLFRTSNYLWVLAQFYAHQQLINNYKLGKMSNDDFLTALLDIFYFLKDNKKIDDPKTLLANAWNNIIDWDEESTDRLNQILDLAKAGEQIYLVANTNALNIEKIISLFATHAPHIQWNPNILQANQDQNRNQNAPSIEIAPNIHLCLSYRYGLFKEGTPGLIKELAQQVKNIVAVISQFPKDWTYAQELGLPTQAADDFYLKVKETPLIAPTKI